MRHVLVALVLFVLASTATAGRMTLSTPTPHASLDGVSLTLTTHTDHTHAIVTVTVATSSESEVEVETLLDLPEGAQVLALAMQPAGERRVVATTIPAIAALESYAGIVERRDDLALVLVPHESDHRFVVRVYPVQVDRSARIDVLIELPVARTVELASDKPIGAVEIVIDDALHHSGALDKPLTVALPEPAHTPHVARMPAPLARGNALYAGDGAARAPSGSVFPAQTRIELDMMPSEDIDEENEIPPVELRKVVRVNLSSLSACFPSGSTTRGRINLRFAVLPNGRPTAVSIDGPGSRSAKRCMSARVGQWRFSSREDVAMASFPLQARVVR